MGPGHFIERRFIERRYVERRIIESGNPLHRKLPCMMGAPNFFEECLTIVWLLSDHVLQALKLFETNFDDLDPFQHLWLLAS